MANAMVLSGLLASPFLPCSCWESCNGSPKWMQTLGGDHGPAIPTRKEVLSPNQQAGKWAPRKRASGLLQTV